MSEESKTFLETIFTSWMKYPKRKAKVAKFGPPESKWVKCPALDLSGGRNPLKGGP